MALDWPRYWRNRSDFNQYNIADCINKMNNDERVAEYYNNAIAFSEFSEKHSNWPQEINRENITDIYSFYDSVIQWYKVVR